MKVTKNCLYCNQSFQTHSYLLSIGKGKYCGLGCKAKSQIGTKFSLETKKKMSENSGHNRLGKHPTEEVREKLRLSHLGQKPWNKGIKGYTTALKGRHWKVKDSSRMGVSSGEKHPMWIKDRSKLAKRQKRYDYAYIWWHKQIKERDKNICRINNKDCFGDCAVHHILSWKYFPELRYNINNGITLCRAHHPRKRAEEKRLAPLFTGLVSVSNELIWH